MTNPSYVMKAHSTTVDLLSQAVDNKDDDSKKMWFIFYNTFCPTIKLTKLVFWNRYELQSKYSRKSITTCCSGFQRTPLVCMGNTDPYAPVICPLFHKKS